MQDSWQEIVLRFDEDAALAQRKSRFVKLVFALISFLLFPLCVILGAWLATKTLVADIWWQIGFILLVSGIFVAYALIRWWCAVMNYRRCLGQEILISRQGIKIGDFFGTWDIPIQVSWRYNVITIVIKGVGKRKFPGAYLEAKPANLKNILETMSAGKVGMELRN